MKRPVPPVTIREPAGNDPIHFHPLMDRLLRSRGIASLDDVNYSLDHLLPPDMAGMDQACRILARHIEAGSRILIVGDYDCDGATATSIAVEGLSLLGAENVDFLVPDRAVHGYGLTPAIVDLAAERKPDLIVTVDNGIASFEGAKAVKAMAHPCELIITDHHLTVDSGELPEAEAIVNPNQPNCSFPSKAIAGCGVMFYVIMALRDHMEREGVFERAQQLPPSLNPLLDLVALGTVADVVPLDRNNRILVAAGLQRINRGEGRPGLTALLSVAKREIGRIVAQDFGFGAGPRLNAAGRLEDMTVGIRCLLTKNPLEAADLAESLDELNLARREIEAGMVAEAAEAAVDDHAMGRDGVVLYNADWHEGVVGIVASRIKEQVNRPVVCFTDTKTARDVKEALNQADTGSERAALEAQYGQREIKGSCRSVPGVHLKHALDRIHKRHPEVLTKFGGHAMAAGVTIPASQLERFKDLFDQEVALEMTDDMRSGLIEVDSDDLDEQHISIDTAQMIADLGPWGQGFPEPVFKGRFQVEGVRVMKDAHLKLMMRASEDGPLIEGVIFNVLEDGDLGVVERISEVEAVYRLDINRFRGKESLQLMIEYLSPGDLSPEKVRGQGKAKPAPVRGGFPASLRKSSSASGRVPAPF